MRRESELVARLMASGMGFTHADRTALFALIGERRARDHSALRALAASGQVELSTTPHYHPLAPLLLDFAVAREARPELPLPAAGGYPGGTRARRARSQSALDSHARRFGVRADGRVAGGGRRVGARSCACSRRTACAGPPAASGVLAQSLRAANVLAADRARYLYRPYRAGRATASSASSATTGSRT